MIEKPLRSSVRRSAAMVTAIIGSCVSPVQVTSLSSVVSCVITSPHWTWLAAAGPEAMAKMNATKSAPRRTGPRGFIRRSFPPRESLQLLTAHPYAVRHTVSASAVPATVDCARLSVDAVEQVVVGRVLADGVACVHIDTSPVFRRRALRVAEHVPARLVLLDQHASHRGHADAGPALGGGVLHDVPANPIEQQDRRC